MADFDLYELQERLAELSPMPGLPIPAIPSHPGGGTGMFSGFRDAPAVGQVIAAPVHEGGGETNRWEAFNRVAGAYIRQAQSGQIDLDTARELTATWVAAKMVPPWPDRRFEQEWRGLVAHASKASQPAIWQPPSLLVPSGVQGPMPVETELATWGADWLDPDPGPRPHMVRGLIFERDMHALIAAPGAGKTMVAIDYAIKTSQYRPGDRLDWLGQPLTDGCGGACVMFTNEDSRHEIARRVHEIDPHRLRDRDRLNLMVIPTADAGGVYSLVEYNPQTRTATASRAWNHWIDQMKRWQDQHKRPIGTVIVDTFSSSLHGNENDATIVNEYMRQARRVNSELGAAFLTTHHTKKPGKDPIKDKDDMLECVRGSSAFTGSMRLMIGLWGAYNSGARLRGMNLPPKPASLWDMQVIKQNNPEALEGKRALLRAPGYTLMDVTDRDVFEKVKIGVVRAWLIAVVKLSVLDGHPFTVSGDRGFHLRRNQTPKELWIAEKIIAGHVLTLVEDGRLVGDGKIKSYGKGRWLDVPEGPLATDQDYHLEVKRGGTWEGGRDWSQYRYDPVLDAVVGPDL